jgi:hypothetical protein
MLRPRSIFGDLCHTLPVGRPDDHRLDNPLALRLHLDLGVDINIVEQDQLAAPAVGMEDAILRHSNVGFVTLNDSALPNLDRSLFICPP